MATNYWLILDLAFGLPLFLLGLAGPVVGGRQAAPAFSPRKGSSLPAAILAIAAGSLISACAVPLSRFFGRGSLGLLLLFSYLPMLIFLLLHPQTREAALVNSMRPLRALMVALAAGALGWITGWVAGLLSWDFPATAAFAEVALLQVAFAAADEFCLRGVLLGETLARLRNVPAALLLASSVMVAVQAYHSVPSNALPFGFTSLVVLTLLRSWAAWRVGHFGVSIVLVALYRLAGVIGV